MLAPSNSDFLRIILVWVNQSLDFVRPGKLSLTLSPATSGRKGEALRLPSRGALTCFTREVADASLASY
jgi:hypothetical protein